MEAANVLTGLAGDDELVGGTGSDTIEGGAGADEMDGGTNADDFGAVNINADGTAGDNGVDKDGDTLSYASSDAGVRVSLG